MRKHQVIIVAYIFFYFPSGRYLSAKACPACRWGKSVCPQFYNILHIESFPKADFDSSYTLSMQLKALETPRGGQWLCYTGERFLQAWYRC